MTRSVIAAVVVVLLTSCSMPETKIYSLAILDERTAQAQMVSSGSPLNITVSSPRYLTQPYIAYRASAYQIEIAKYSRWDMSPDDLVLNAFRDAIASSGLFRDVQTFLSSPPGYWVLEINLKRFERVDEGGTSFARLQFDVRLRSPEGRELYHDMISEKTGLEDRTFLELARTLSGSLSEGLNRVKSGIEEVMTSQMQ